MRTTLLTLALFFTTGILSAQQQDIQCYLSDPGGLIREHNVDFIQLDLHVQFAPQEGGVTGKAIYQFKPIQPNVDSVFLDGPGILVENITLDQVNTRFKMDSAGITVYFNPPLTRNSNHQLEINYSAHPKRGLYFNGWNVARTDDPNDPTIIRKQIWTQGQGIDNRHWIPSYDGVNDKVITALHITFENGYTVVSNGNLQSVSDNKNGTSTWHYAMEHPHAMYLIMLAVGKYDVMEFKSKNGITSRQYYYPGTKAHAENTYRYSAELMDWMENEIGLKYPWSTYANVPVQEFLYGAMENTTATIFSDFFYQLPQSNPDKQYVEINAHELTHQWFGDYITAWSGSSHWLQESFATYYAKKFMQSIQGDDFYQWKRREEMLTAINADNNGDFPVSHAAAGSPLVYQKGSTVIDMLRYVVGDTEFHIAIKEFLESHPYANVTTKDFEMQFMESLGINVNWFFDEWLYRDGYPVYKIKWETRYDTTTVTIAQTQQQTETSGLFTMPVHIQAHFADGTFEDKLVMISDSLTNVQFYNNKRQISFILFDPNKMIMSKVDFLRSYEELRFQAHNAPNMMDRYDAIVAMRDWDLDKKQDDLIALYKKERWHGIRSEIIAQLADGDNKAVISVMREAIYDSDPLVRRAVLLNLDTMPSKLDKDLETLLKDENYTNTEIALRKLSEWEPDKTQAYLQATNGMYGATNNIRIAWLEIMCKQSANAKAGELVAFAGPQYEFRTRVAAFNALQSLNYCNEELVAHLFNAVINTNHRLATPARNTLLALKKSPEYATMIRNYYQSKTWSEWEEKRLGTVKD